MGIGLAVLAACNSEVPEGVVSTREQAVWAEVGSPFLSTWENVDDETVGTFGSVVALTNSGGIFCSGTLVAPGIVVTASHCVTCGANILVRAGANAEVNPNAYEDLGRAHCSPSMGDEDDQWPGDGPASRLGANDIAVIELSSAIPSSLASVSRVYLGRRSGNGLDLHEGGGNPSVSSVATVVGYGWTCRLGNCGAGFPYGDRWKVDAWAYNWYDPCGNLESGACSSVPTIAISSARSEAGFSDGDSGGALFRHNMLIGVVSLAIPSNPGGFVGSVFAPVTTNVQNARWLVRWIKPEGDVGLEDIGILGAEVANVHDRAVVNGVIGGGDVEIGSDALVEGDVFSEDSVLIRERGGFTGNLKAYGGIDTQNQLGQIGAIDREISALPLQSLNAFASYLATLEFTESPYWVNYEPPNSGVRVVELEPGQHGAIRIKRDVHLHLGSGTYYFRSLDVDSQARIAIDTTEPVRIFVDQVVDIKGGLVSLASTNNVLLAQVSANPLHVQHDFRAAIVAPSARIEVHNFHEFVGQLVAEEVVLHQDATFAFKPFSGSSWESP